MENQDNQTPPSGDQDGGNAPDWKSHFPEEYQKSISKFDTPEALVKSYRSLESAYNESGRKDAIFKPGEDATPEEISTFYAKLGRLDSADKYDITIEGLDDDRTAALKQTAYDMGLTPKQAAKFAETVGSTVDAERKAADTKQTMEYSEVEAKLKDRWGEKYDLMVNFGKKYAELADPRDKEAIRKLSATSPEFNVILAELGQKAFGKKSIIDDIATPDSMGPEELTEKARALTSEIDKLDKIRDGNKIEALRRQRTEYYRQAAEARAGR